jgi:Uri superfamily endonuclease
MKGCYVLLVRLRHAKRIEVGRLGSFHFTPGYYAYVGSAMLSLEKRIARHLRGEKRKHWHIDYLLEVATLIAVFSIISENKCECALAQLLRSLQGSQVPVLGFGSSDCSCGAHLFYFEENPEQAIYSSLKRFSMESNLTLIFERLVE